MLLLFGNESLSIRKLKYEQNNGRNLSPKDSPTATKEAPNVNSMHTRYAREQKGSLSRAWESWKIARFSSLCMRDETSSVCPPSLYQVFLHERICYMCLPSAARISIVRILASAKYSMHISIMKLCNNVRHVSNTRVRYNCCMYF